MQYIQEFKIITLGDSGVGKTSIIKRYCDKKFNDNNQSTIGINFPYKEMNVDKKNKKIKIKLKLIDTCGQEKYKSLSKAYYRNADAVLFIFSMNETDTLDTINGWMESFKDNNNKAEEILKYLVGTKNDLEIKVNQSLIDEFSQKNNLKFISTSAKKNNNIDELFEEIGKKLYSKLGEKGDFNQKNFKINEIKETKKRNGCCNINMAEAKAFK